MQELNPRPKSAYSFGHRIKARLWEFVNSTLFRWSFFFMRRYRIAILRLFGANIDWSCSIDSSATIVEPWNLTMRRKASIGEHTCIRCRDKVELGEHAIVGRDVYLLTASHNLSSRTFDMVTAPITIGDFAWIATRATVSKGVTIGDGAVVAAESNVIKDVEPWTVVGGNPARFIKERVIKD